MLLWGRAEGDGHKKTKRFPVFPFHRKLPFQPPTAARPPDRFAEVWPLFENAALTPFSTRQPGAMAIRFPNGAQFFSSVPRGA
jgi:hypothetical protein